MAHLARFTRHARRPQLRYAYRTCFDAATRGFVFRTLDDRWLAALTPSQTRPDYWLTALMLAK